MLTVMSASCPPVVSYQPTNAAIVATTTQRLYLDLNFVDSEKTSRSTIVEAPRACLCLLRFSAFATTVG
jgi:hypothetical protein